MKYQIVMNLPNLITMGGCGKHSNKVKCRYERLCVGRLLKRVEANREGEAVSTKNTKKEAR